MTQPQPLPLEVPLSRRQLTREHFDHVVHLGCRVAKVLNEIDAILDACPTNLQSEVHCRLCNHLEAIAHKLWDDASEPGDPSQWPT